MIGFCLAAGAGSRLAPLTRVTPKPLLAPAGRPLVELAVEALQTAGATRVVVNAHHGADQLAAQLAGRSGVEVVVEPVLLGTGGGLVGAARLGLLGDGDDPVLATSADHVVDPADLTALAAFLERVGAPMVAGLVPAVVDPFGLRLEGSAADPQGGSGTTAEPPPPGGRLWTTAGPPLPGELRSPTGGAGAVARGSPMPVGEGPDPGGAGAVARGSPVPAGEGSALAGGWVVRDPDGPWDSAGAYAVRAGLLRELEPGPATLVARVLGPLLARDRLAGLPFRGAMADAGTLDRLLDVSAGLLAGRWPYELPPGRLVEPTEAGDGGDGQRVGAAGAGDRGAGDLRVVRGLVFVAAGAEVDPGAVVAGPVVLDAGCRVGPGAVITRSVVGPGVRVGPGARVVGSVLGPGAVLAAGATAVAALVPGRRDRSTTTGTPAAKRGAERAR